MVGAAGAVAAVVLDVILTVTKGNQRMLPGDFHQYFMRCGAVEVATLDKHGLAGKCDFIAARHKHPGPGHGGSWRAPLAFDRPPCRPGWLHVGEVFTAVVAEEAGSVVKAQASGADDFTFCLVMTLGGKWQAALSAGFLAGLILGVASRTQRFVSFGHCYSPRS